MTDRLTDGVGGMGEREEPVTSGERLTGDAPDPAARTPLAAGSGATDAGLPGDPDDGRYASTIPLRTYGERTGR